MCLISTKISTPLLQLLKIILWNEMWDTVCPTGVRLLPELLSSRR